MGAAKERMIEEWERGYAHIGGAICSDCVDDEALKDWVGANATEHECTFCGTSRDEPHAAPFEPFVALVLAGLAFDWNHPDDEGIMFISREGGYQAPVSQTYEVLYDAGISERDEVVSALSNAIMCDSWVSRDFYMGDDAQQLSWGWDRFKHIAKHETRYFFQQDDDHGPYGERLTPSDMLQAITGSIRSDFGGYDLIRPIPAGTDILRVRVDNDAHATAAEIGPPPIERAKQSNRMSPAGIPMFYGAFDRATAVAETVELPRHAGLVASIGTFQPARNLLVLDLADLPGVPSVFDLERHSLIHTLRFLHAFADDISGPIARDGLEHIDYVPTQIVTEYFRRVFRMADGIALDGIVYRSSRNGERAIVIFCGNRDCVDADVAERGDTVLRMTEVNHQPC